MTQAPDISVVLPCYNEVGNIEPLVAELRQALDPLGRSYEIIYIDDASTDGTTEKLNELAAQMPFLRTVRHRTNFGESAGQLTGFAATRGSIIITMDADLQNDPADIPQMLARLESLDCVCGVRRKREDSIVKRISSRVANRVRDWLVNDNIHDAGCTYRAIRRECLQQFPPAFRALHRWLPTILKLHGYRVEEMLVNHRPRSRGVSKYGVGNRLWVGILDIVGIRWYKKRFLPPNRTDKG